MDYVDKKLLMSAAENFGVEINAEQAEKFEGYARLLFEWNQKMNLTAITSPEGVALLHFADSLTLLSAVKEFSLGENDRRVIIIDKIFPISQKYPRQSGKIKKSPL